MKKPILTIIGSMVILGGNSFAADVNSTTTNTPTSSVATPVSIESAVVPAPATTPVSPSTVPAASQAVPVAAAPAATAAVPAAIPSSATTPASTPASASAPAAPAVCSGVVKSCETAGFVQNGPTGKDVWMNCVAPVLMGKAVVKVDDQQVAACKADINNLPCSKLLSICKNAGYTGGPQKLAFFDCMVPLTQGVVLSGVTAPPDVLSACKAQVDSQIKQQPCLRVMLACKAGGYSPDNVNGQAFARNCYMPVLNGQTVFGVVVDPETAAACKKFISTTNTLITKPGQQGQ